MCKVLRRTSRLTKFAPRSCKKKNPMTLRERSSTTWALRKAVEAASSTRNLKYVNVSGTSSRYHLIQCSKDAVKDVRRRRSTRTPPTRLVCDLSCNLVRDLPMFTTSGSWTFQATKVRLRTTALLAFLEFSTADHRISLWCMFSSCKTLVRKPPNARESKHVEGSQKRRS